MAVGVETVLGDCEHLLGDDLCALLEQGRSDWRAVPVEEARELALSAHRWSDRELDGLLERIALVEAIGRELRQGRSLGFDVLRAAITDAYGDKPPAEFSPSEKKAIAEVMGRIYARPRRARIRESNGR